METPSNDAVLNSLAASTASISTNVQALVQVMSSEVTKTNSIKRQSRLTQILIGMIVIMCLLLGYQTYSARRDTATRSAAATAQRAEQSRTLAAIDSCITPGHPCYERALAAQKAQSDHNAGLSHCIVLANGDVAVFDACLKELDAG